MVSTVTAGSWWPGMWAINSAVGRFTPPSPLPLCLLLGWGEVFLPHSQLSGTDALTPHHGGQEGWPGGHCSPNTHTHTHTHTHTLTRAGMHRQTQASVCRHCCLCQRGLPWTATNTNSPGSLEMVEAAAATQAPRLRGRCLSGLGPLPPLPDPPTPVLFSGMD